VTIHPAYNIHGCEIRDARCTGTISTQRSDRGGGKVERREVAIPRAVSCSHVQPRASFCRTFYLFFAYPVILTSGAARCIGTAEKNALAISTNGRRRLANARSREKSRGGCQRVAAKGQTGWEIIGTFCQRCLIFRK